MKVTEPDAPEAALVDGDEVVEPVALAPDAEPPFPHAATTAARNKTANKRNDILVKSLIHTWYDDRRADSKVDKTSRQSWFST
ncbi:MAG: hypothetical protein HZC22_13615 [Rhodocyclales bacterium]|nr:hypothetical protein [Rhodocyclales bacterium]